MSSVIDRLASTHQGREEFPWLLPGQDNELWLVSRAGAVQVWNGREFEERFPAVQENTSFAMAALPASKQELMLTLAVYPDQPLPFVVRTGSDGVTAQEKLEEGSSPEIRSLWADRGTEAVFGVGMNGAIVRRTPYESWVALSSPTKAPLLDVEGTSATDLWAVGGGGVSLHFDGTQWQKVETGTQENLIAVAAASKDNVWAVGMRGTALHFDGTSWRSIDTGVSTTLRTVAFHGGEVWLGGDEGLILHGTGGQWRREDAPTPASIMSFGVAGGALFAATNAQTPCFFSLNAVELYYGGSSRHAAMVTRRMLPAGALQASISEWVGWTHGASWPDFLRIRIPSAFRCALIFTAAPLVLLAVIAWRRGLRWAYGVIGLAWMAGGACILWGARDIPEMYVFRFHSPNSLFSVQGVELTGAQDLLLFEYERALDPALRSADRGSPVHELIRQRYPRFGKYLASSSRAYLGECADTPRPPELRYARCAGGDSSWVPKVYRLKP